MQLEIQRHNDEVAVIWDGYRAAKPTRVPIIFGINPRFTMNIPEANPRRIRFEQYVNDPQLMLERQIEHLHWVRHNVPQDVEMGVPKEGWTVGVDFQNTCEAAWFGCPWHFDDDQVPDTRAILNSDDARFLLFDHGLPDPFSAGIMRRNWEYFEWMQRRKQEGATYFGAPIGEIRPAGLGTDGPLTVACNLRGATEFMTDLAVEPEYALRLLDFITTATIQRIRAFRKRLNLPLKSSGWGFADDSVQLISTSMYREMILPFHRRLADELSDGVNIGIHLCGDSTRHFKTLRDELNVRSFDTGFPVNFTNLRDSLGTEVQIQGGPHIAFLLRATPEEVRREVQRILASGVCSGGRFILREGNNLPPGVSLENLHAMYEAGKYYGRYR